MKVPHLMSIRPTEWWLATLNAFSAIMFALEQAKAAQIGVICQSASSVPRFLLARVQLSICFPISLSRIHRTASLYLCPADAFKTFCSNKLKIVTGTSWHFSDISSDMYASWAQESTTKAPHLMSIRPMECWLATLNASSAIMSHALEQINAARTGVICKSASSAPNCLLSRVQLSICHSISLSPIHLTASLYLWFCPPDCFQEIMFEQARTSHSNNLGFFGTYQDWLLRSHPIFRRESWNQHICPLHARK